MNYKLIKWKLISNLTSARFVFIIIMSFLFTYIQIKTTNNWEEMGLNNFLLYSLNFGLGKGTSYYILLLPFLSSLMGGSLIGEEIRSRRNIFQQTRISKKEYTLSMLFTSFILGGIGGALPMIISFICSFIKSPYLKTNLGEYQIFNHDFWGYQIFNRSNLMMACLLLLIIFIFCGLFSMLSVSLSYFFPLKIIETLFVMIFFYIMFFIFSLLNLDVLSYNVFLNFPVSQDFNNSLFALIGYAIIFVVIIAATTLWEIKTDDFETVKNKNN